MPTQPSEPLIVCRKPRIALHLFIALLLPCIAIACTTHKAPSREPTTRSTAAAPQFKPLFPDAAALANNWSVRLWSDLAKPAADSAWELRDGILECAKDRGSWLISNAEYSDFVLELDFRIGPQGNSGVALRAPDHGDPAYDGMELQIVDPRYYGGKGEPAQLAGSIYRGIPPKKDVFKPEAWNTYQITCQGPHVKVVLNGEVIQDANLDEQTTPLHRDDPSKITPSLKDRPRRGHIGFQELSRGGTHVEIRNARLKVLPTAGQ